MQLRSAALSDIGRVRQRNEDRFLCDPALQAYGVADGVGGLPGGAEAAQCAVDLATRLISAANGEPLVDLEGIFTRANTEVARLGERLSPGLGIATTLTLGVMRGRTLHLAHVGDSRCYLLRDGLCDLVTVDHSVENEARRRRERGEVVMFNEANRNALTRCIGQPGSVEVDVAAIDLQVGDRIFFCSDGVSKMVPHPELAALLAREFPPAIVLQDIISGALVRGGIDNATGVVLFIDAV